MQETYVSFIPFFVFGFWSLLKLQRYNTIFVYILQGKMGKTGENRKKIMQQSDQNTKNPKTKKWDERYNNFFIGKF